MVKIENQPNYIFEDLTTSEDELGGYVPMTFNDDYELYGLEFYPEAPMKQEINFMKMLCSWIQGLGGEWMGGFTFLF